MSFMYGTAPNQPSIFTDFGTNVSKNIKDTSGIVLSIYSANINEEDRYLQLHNMTLSPIVGSVPMLSFLLPGGNGTLILGSDFLTNSGILFSLGISYGFSLSKAVYSPAAAADQSLTVMYR